MTFTVSFFQRSLLSLSPESPPPCVSWPWTHTVQPVSMEDATTIQFNSYLDVFGHCPQLYGQPSATPHSVSHSNGIQETLSLCLGGKRGELYL